LVARAMVSAMSTHAPRRADHARYITAIRGAVEARDIRVTDMQVSASPDGRREAVLTLRPDSEAFAERVPEAASASWDEDNGWSIGVRGGLPAGRVHKGLSVLPDPEDVAAWVVVVLAHPELTPSYEDHPFRDHEVADPEFEVQLARYAARP
jgi:Family of unknown function (DUF6292)